MAKVTLIITIESLKISIDVHTRRIDSKHGNRQRQRQRWQVYKSKYEIYIKQASRIVSIIY
mgnify:CR=1 FL=1